MFEFASYNPTEYHPAMSVTLAGLKLPESNKGNGALEMLQ